MVFVIPAQKLCQGTIKPLRVEMNLINQLIYYLK